MTDLLKGIKKNPILYVLVLAIIISVVGINETLSFATNFLINDKWFVNTLLFLLFIGLIGFYLLKIRVWR